MNEITVEKNRIGSIDMLRGIIIIIMGLDHVRDFISPTDFNLLDVARTTPAWYFTRWITHYCAPAFVFLAGISAFIYGQKVSKQTLSKFLMTRGLWLIFIEFTFVKFGWTFDLTTYFVQVIWVIGWSMIILGVLIFLPRGLIMVFTAIFIVGHNLLDTISIDAYWWQFLHQVRFQPPLFIVYPLIPWPAVMSLGYLVGNIFVLPSGKRKRNLVILGATLSVVFIVIRFIDMYGDPQPWSVQQRGMLYTFLDFLDTTKYPPSLLYICMTLGPSLLLLALLDNFSGRMAAFLQTFGRVPFFYYVVHLYIAHIMSVIYNGIVFHEWKSFGFGQRPEGYEPSLLRIYISWLILTLIMYLLCRWFSNVKKKYSYWWLKYL